MVFLLSGKSKVTNFQIAVIVDQDIARFEVTMDNTRRMDIFQPPLRQSGMNDPCANIREDVQGSDR